LTAAPAVPEASSSIGLGVMLGLGGLALIARRRVRKA
jgi:MYXO-CTERM domain-containing protein